MYKVKSYYNMEKFIASSKQVIQKIKQYISETRQRNNTETKEDRKITHKDFKKFIPPVLVTLFIVLVTIIMALCSQNGLFGYTVRIVITGSMEPTIKVNSLNIVKICDIDEIEQGDIVCYTYGKDIIHRATYIKQTSNGKVLTTQGDANKSSDGIDVTSDMLVGKVVKTFNGIGSWFVALRISPGDTGKLWIFISILANIILIYVTVSIIKYMVYFTKIFIGLIKNKGIKYDTKNKLVRNMKKLKESMNNTEFSVNNNVDNTANTRIQFIISCVNKTRYEMKLRGLNSDIEELTKTIDSMDTTDKVVSELETEEASKDIIKVIKRIHDEKKSKRGGGE